MKDPSTRATLECLRGDIARQSGVEAVVNAAYAELRIGGGVAGALHRTAGPLQRCASGSATHRRPHPRARAKQRGPRPIKAAVLS
jgi:O-acetyl-ADP-ribose deacetylase (regulator of RNase III)